MKHIFCQNDERAATSTSYFVAKQGKRKGESINGCKWIIDVLELFFAREKLDYLFICIIYC